MVISSALPNTAKSDVERVMLELDLGELEGIDMVNAQSRGKPCLKFFIHYKTTSPNAIRLRARLDDNDDAQKTGEIVPPVRIIYNRTRDGRDQYWQVYKAKTPAQRLAEQTGKTPTFVPTIEM